MAASCAAAETILPIEPFRPLTFLVACRPITPAKINLQLLTVGIRCADTSGGRLRAIQPSMVALWMLEQTDQCLRASVPAFHNRKSAL